jgi:hypothetical protein
MKNIIRIFALLLLLFVLSAQAVQIEVEIKGQKQIVEFNPDDKADMDRAWNLWRKSDNRQYYVYSETGIFQVYDAPRDDAKKIEVGSWYQQLDSRFQQSPELVHLTWDKNKWFPKFPSTGTDWIKLDDPNLINPDQLKPVKEWPIRYFAYFRGTDTAAAEAGIKPKYDEYIRYQFDREGYLLDNRTMKRRKTSDGWWRRMFIYRDFVHLTPVLPNEVDMPIFKGGGPALSFNLKKALVDPKIEYDKESGFISIWGSFDDPVKPVLDKSNGNACVIDCENRKRWEP